MTPFGRQAVTAGHLAAAALAEAPAPQVTPDKWALLRDLTAARAAYGVSDRDLAVLSALLSFHPAKELADDDRLIVFPSNAALSDRAHGMAESTLRRHLAALVRAGLIVRRDSPNGKRYATRAMSGAFDTVFGFDLRPLLVRAPQIAADAAEAHAAALALRRLRETVVIRLRNAAKLIVWGMETTAGAWEGLLDACAALQRQLRRKLTVDSLRALADQAADLLDHVHGEIPTQTQEMGGNAVKNERHYHNSKSDSYESEPCQERQVPKVTVSPELEPSIPLGLVLKAAPGIHDYAPDGIRSWRDLLAVAEFVRPMLGVSSDAWARARHVMGDHTAAITLACILQRSAQIMRPGGYLRSLTDKAEDAGFSPAPMVMALIRAENVRPI